jgi:carotenoid cleavage dioxygenase-like enzyme
MIFIFAEQSLKFDVAKFLQNLILNKPYSNALVMKRNFRTRIHIMNKRTGEVVKQKFDTEPLFVFHNLNAYEKTDSGEIIVDVCAYDANYFDVNKLSRDGMFTAECLGNKALKSIARRITVPFKRSEFSEKPIHCQVADINSEVAFELPNINYSAYNGKPYKYVYGVNFYKLPFSIVKINVDKGADMLEFKYEQEGREFLPTEPVFVANPNGSDEDDGVLLVLVLSDKRDFLSILNAKDLKEIARAEMPEDTKSSFTFHGFFADKQNFPKLN